MQKLLYLVLAMLVALSPMPHTLVKAKTLEEHAPLDFPIEESEGFFVMKITEPALTNVRLSKSPEDIRLDQMRLEEERRIEAARTLEQSHVTAEPRRAPSPTHTPQIEAVVPEPANVTSVEQIAHSMTSDAFGEGQWLAMRALLMSESGMNPNAVNKSSGACGLPQALPCSKLKDKSTEGQIRWMLQYIKDRYGNPDKAWSFHLQHNWY